jgi:uncharacterized FlaG/YvyC family protein
MAEQNLINPIASSASLELGVGLSGAGAKGSAAGTNPTRGASAATAAVAGAPSGALQSAAQKINTWLASVGRVMELHVDAASGVTVATIKDAQTGRVLQQMPSADLLELAELISGWSHGKAALLDLIA